jgi:hypothetical protein
LERAYELREIWTLGLITNPELDPLRNEPRFKVLMKKIHLD